MKAFLSGLLLVCAHGVNLCSPGEADTVQLSWLVRETLRNNPAIDAALQQMFVMDAKVPQEGSLPPPEIIYMREGMPRFKSEEAMFTRIELMQMFPFPTKLAKRREIAEIVADHAHHDHLEKVFEVVGRVKNAYIELWYIQEATILIRRNAEILSQVVDAARTRYSVGRGGQQEFLKAYVEAAKTENQLLGLRQRELGMKAMIAGLLNRPAADTLGRAVLADSVDFPYSLETLTEAALSFRPMLQHDSLMIEEKDAMIAMAKQEYLPDFRIGVQYMTAPMTGFTGWTVTAGITVPFAPWALAGASGKVEEAEAGRSKAAANLTDSRAMVTSTIRDLYYRAEGERRQLETYRKSILPRARQSLNASVVAFQTGKTDFLMLLDSYRMLVELGIDSLMHRMEFEQTVARLEREIGVTEISRIR